MFSVFQSSTVFLFETQIVPMLTSGAPSCWLLSPFDMTLSGFENKGYIFLKAIKFPLENRAKSLLAITQKAFTLWKRAIQ